MSDAAAGWDCHVHIFDPALPVIDGHYRPASHPLERIEEEAARCGVGHLVLVQPSVYGTDNTLLLRALAAEPGRHRGIVVIDGDIGDEELDAMHAQGVRGARLNLVSPVGNSSGFEHRVIGLAARLQERGWHLQWYAQPHQLPRVAALHARLGVTCVLDHLAGMHNGLTAGDPAWLALRALADHGAWIKLSGWYRLGASAPYAELLPVVLSVVQLFGERVVWGSDWPHTLFAAEAMPSYQSTLQPVTDALGALPGRVLIDRFPAIYR